jgi:hypothetical protein
MANYLYTFSANITITSSNKHIYFKQHDSPYTAYDVSVTENTYDDIVELCTAIKTAMDGAACSDVFTVSMASGAWDSTYLNPQVRISDSLGTFELSCRTTTNSIWSTIGFSTAADRTGQSYYDSNYQPLYMWTSDHPPFFDSYDRPWITGGEPFVSKSGQLRRVTNPTNLYTRIIDFGNVTKEKTLAAYATGGYTNQDFVTFWQTVARGTPFALYISPDDGMTEGGESGTYCLLEPVGDLSRDTITRLSEAAEFYSWSMKMLKDPT